MVVVTLEGKDPARTTKLLDGPARRVQEHGRRRDNDEKIDETKEYRRDSAGQAQAASSRSSRTTSSTTSRRPDHRPGGQEHLRGAVRRPRLDLLHKQMRLDELQQQTCGRAALPQARLRPRPGVAATERRSPSSQETQKLDSSSESDRRSIRNFDERPGRPASTRSELERGHRRARRARSRSKPARPSADPTEMILDRYQEEHPRTTRPSTRRSWRSSRTSMPEHQKFLSPGRGARSRRRSGSRDGPEDLASSRSSRRSQKEPGQDPRRASSSRRSPIRPSRVDEHRAWASSLSFGLGIGLVCLLEHLDHSVKVPEHLTVGPDPAAARGRPADPPDGADPPGRAPLDPGHARLGRGRRLPEPPRQPAGRRRPARADRHAAGHQRQGGRGQEHDRPEPGRHLRPGRRADPADGRRPPPAQPRRRLPGRRRARASAWSTSSGATSPGSGPSSAPTCRTSTSCRPATPATSRSRSSGTLELRQLLIAPVATTTTG